jgi:hypothetical protein
VKPGGGKRKGNGYEIKISKILSKWYVKNFKRINEVKNKHDYFWRTAGSGAKSTVNRSSQTSFTGDITFLPTPDRLKIWIDCKSVKNITFDNVLSGKFLPGKWHHEEVEKMNKLGIEKPVVIIFKLYRKKENYIFYATIDFKFDNLLQLKESIYHKGFSIALLKEFLKSVKKENIIK